MDTLLQSYPPDKMWDFENGFYLTAPPIRMAKLLAHYELYKKAISIPGHIVECGVYKAASLMRFISFRNLFETEFSKKIIAFDAFGTFPKEENEADNSFIESFEEQSGDGLTKSEVEAYIQNKNISNVELIEGNINNTLPEYCFQHPELKVSLLHIDVDVYSPTKTILEHLYQRVVPGGIIILDDYGTVFGETQAVDDFFEAKEVKIKKLPFAHIPAYIEKPHEGAK